MDDRANIDAFLDGGPFAVVGASRDRAKYGNKVLRAYLQDGREAHPVNPRESEIEGVPCHADLASIPVDLHGASIITPPAVTEQVMTPENVSYMRGKGAHFIPPEGESYRMVERRYSNWIEDEILYNDDIISQPKSLRIAVVSHGAASRCLFHYIMGFDENLIWRIVLDNTSISRFRFNKFGWTPVSINDSSHILSAGLTAASEITP